MEIRLNIPTDMEICVIVLGLTEVNHERLLQAKNY